MQQVEAQASRRHSRSGGYRKHPEVPLKFPWGWSLKGTRLLAEPPGHRTCRGSMAAARCCGEVLAPLTFESYCHGELVVSWFKQQLCPALRAGRVVILDNASFHPMKRLAALVEAAGCILLPWPRCSPDLNKIEHLYPQFKNRIALDANSTPSFRLKVEQAQGRAGSRSSRLKVDAAFT